MISALLLATYAALLAVVARRLPAAAWPNTAPRAAIVMWQLIAGSWVVSVTLSGLALLFPALHLSRDLAALLGACSPDLRAHYGTPFGRVGAALGGVIAALVAARVAYCAARTVARVRVDRARHRAVAALARHGVTDNGVVVVNERTPLAYCMPRSRPGRPHTIVVSSEAVRRLSDVQLRAVIAHETSHLRRRHHRALGWLSSLSAAFPWVSVLRLAQSQVARLTELHADDIAGRAIDPLDLAEALIVMSQTSPPDARVRRAEEALEQGTAFDATASPGRRAAQRGVALGIAEDSDTGLVDRVRRLITPPARIGARKMVAIALCATGIISAPVAASVAPALSARTADQADAQH